VSDKTSRPDPSLRLYGRRKGKRLRSGRKALIDNALSSLQIDLDSCVEPITCEHLFQHGVDALWLEIGFGSGEHIAAQALAHPNIGFIGAEVFENGIASLLQHCEQKNLSNIRIFNDDVRALIPALERGVLERVFLLYPDPWPKTRHAKRRFICTESLSKLARVMSPGAELRIATDHPIYARWCLLHGPIHPYFDWKVSSPDDWRQRPSDSIATRYEKKALREGRIPFYLTLTRSASRKGKNLA